MKVTVEGTKVLVFPDSKVNYSTFAEALKQSVRKRLEFRQLLPYEKGLIGERLAECYINAELIPSMKKKEGWTDIYMLKHGLIMIKDSIIQDTLNLL